MTFDDLRSNPSLTLNCTHDEVIFRHCNICIWRHVLDPPACQLRFLVPCMGCSVLWFLTVPFAVQNTTPLAVACKSSASSMCYPNPQLPRDTAVCFLALLPLGHEAGHIGDLSYKGAVCNRIIC